MGHIICHSPITVPPSAIILKLIPILVTILKGERVIVNFIMNLMILFMCRYYLSCMIQVAILSNLLLVIATTMKEEVTSALLMLVIIIQIHMLVKCMDVLIISIIQSSIKYTCIGRKLELKLVGSMHHDLFYQALN